MVWKKIADYPNDYTDIPISYNTLNPDLATYYPFLEYEHMITHYPRYLIVDTEANLEYKFVVRPLDSEYPTQEVSLAINDFFSMETCYPTCSKIYV